MIIIIEKQASIAGISALTFSMIITIRYVLKVEMLFLL